ncbi:hypothetical protein DFH06DRAFT_1301661 [Mycena polygramma]|nr:hypothetical protein DFH06DRAFT_1301661 [Mycena polygramma]
MLETRVREAVKQPPPIAYILHPSSHIVMSHPPDPRFPQDIEQIITEMLLDEERDMAGTMSRVAARFYHWSKTKALHTVVVHYRPDWTKRISELFIPNAAFIRILAIDLPLTRGRLTNEELSLIQRLLQASDGVIHLAVSWHIWEHFGSECGSMHLQSLYLIWDVVYNIPPPSSEHLKHRSTLREITIYAPPQLDGSEWPWAETYMLATIIEECPNITHVAYATSRHVPDIGFYSRGDSGFDGGPHVMWVLVDSPTKFLDYPAEKEIFEDEALYPNSSTSYLRFSSEILGEWLAKMEGKTSVLDASSAGWTGRGEWTSLYLYWPN